MEKENYFEKYKTARLTLAKAMANFYDCILPVEEAKKYGADILIRGLRNGTDYQYEENISEMNEQISGIDTCYFRAGELGYLSSSLVMDLFKNNYPIDEYVPKQVAKLLYSKR